MEYINNFDFKILDFIYENLHTDFLDNVVPYISSLASSGRIWILVALILIIIPKTRKIGVAALIALIIGYVVNNMVLKEVFHRIRPYDLNTGVQLIVRPPHDYSFPSGHTCSSFSAASAMFILDKRIGIPAIILAALIGLTRLYLYVHYPTDVLGGALVGILAGMVATKIVKSKAIEAKLLRRIE